MDKHCWHAIEKHWSDTDPDGICCHCAALRVTSADGAVTFRTRDPAHGPHVAASVDVGEKEPDCAASKL